MKISRLMVVNIVITLLIQGAYYALYGSSTSKIKTVTQQVQFELSHPTTAINCPD